MARMLVQLSLGTATLVKVYLYQLDVLVVPSYYL